MRSTVSLIALAGMLITSSCGSKKPPPKQPKGVQALLIEAKRCEKEAGSHDDMARVEAEPHGASGHKDRCADRSIDHASTTGGEPLTVFHPCWTVELHPGDHHRREAERLRADAARYRAEAQALEEMEQRTCSGLSQDAIDHSPFFHGEDILRVEPYQDEEVLRGARVLFRKVPGLTVGWMRQAVECHLARAAVMGHSTRFQPYCPLMLEGVTVAVSETAEGIEVLLRAKRDDIAAAVLGRVQDRIQSCEPQPTASSTRAGSRARHR